MSRVKNAPPWSLGLAPPAAWGRVRPAPGSARGKTGSRRTPGCCVEAMEAALLCVQSPRSPDLLWLMGPGFGGGVQAGRQAGKARIYGKAASGMCGRASWSPGRWPPDRGGPWSLESGCRNPPEAGEGWLCNYDVTVTQKVTLLRSTALVLPPSEGRRDPAALALGTALALKFIIPRAIWRAVKT